LVFTSTIDTPLFPRKVSRRFHQLLDEAKIERRGMHATRHTTATLLMTAGEHPKVVQELLGPATIALTLDTYSHVTEGQRKQATAKLGALLTPVTGGLVAESGE
jgi:site-specific recombinase XerD